MAETFTYKVLDRYAILSAKGNVTKEVRKVRFGDGPTKIDIRCWRQTKNGEVMMRGITLDETELRRLKEALPIVSL